MNNLRFNFDKYELAEPRTLVFHYSYRDDAGQPVGSFAERYLLPVDVDLADPASQYILQQLHIVVGVSYYKSLLGPVSLPYRLSPGEADYWNTVYDNGLSEYAYLNSVKQPIRPFMADPGAPEHHATGRPDQNGAILGVGGGKDSIVAGELFKLIGLDTTTMDMATRDHHGQAGAVMEIMGLSQLRVERYVDTSIIDFTKQHEGSNGHVPLSAILAWLGVLLAYTSGRRYVAMANEAAASVGNVEWNGRQVNHQWSKSLEFESLTQDFIHSHISPDITYFSPIRPFGSLAVIELLVKLGGPYLEDFTSCNLVLRIDPSQRPNGRWCTLCAKCLSTCLLLSTVLPADQLAKVFGRDMFDDKSLRPLLEELLGLQGHKPLDCVGTTEELRAATRHALVELSQTPLLSGLKPDAIPGPDIDELIHQIGEHRLPEALADQLISAVNDKLGK